MNWPILLSDQQVASFSFCEVAHPTNDELCFQFSRMAIPASLGEKAHQAFVVTVAKIDENGTRHNQNLIGGHCRQLQGRHSGARHSYADPPFFAK